MNIKKCNAAGTFYPADKKELLSVIDDFYSKTENASGYYSRAIIVPHAGYAFSGELAAAGYRYLNPESENIFIFAPSHYSRLFGCVSSNYDAFGTPLAECRVNKGFASEFEVNNEAFEKEHSIEVQLPFIKYFFKDTKIIPVLYGCEDYRNISKIIENYWEDERNSFVISSDLSHFYPEREASRIDTYTAAMIESGNIKNFDAEQACGAVGICGLVDFASSCGASLIRTGLTNSSAKTGDTSRVVGYGSWFLFEGDKSTYIKEFFSDFVIDVCKKSILSGFQLGEFEVKDYPCVFDEAGACFVTLRIKGNLRGCVGSVIAHRSLIKDLMSNAHSAAFRDTSFNPLTPQEFENLDISVSLLSAPEKIEFTDEKDLLTKIKPNGLIIRDGNFQAVYLPEVWEEQPDEREILTSLKQKAGMAEDYFSDALQAFRFKTLKINQ